MTEVIDISRDKETGEITQFTIIDDSGQPQLVKATPENMLLYDPDDELPFDDGMYELFSGEKAVILSDEPEVIVAPTANEYCYILRVDGRTVETTPEQSERVLTGIKRAAIDGDVETLVDVYDYIRRNQVRRSVINALSDTFDEKERIDITGRGWMIDGFYLVNWEASLYLRHNDPDEPDYTRGGGGVTETDEGREFMNLNIRRDVEPVRVTISGESYKLTEREMLFLAKVTFLLDRRSYHPDNPFWMYSDKWADVDYLTGEPESGDGSEDDEPDLDKFEI